MLTKSDTLRILAQLGHRPDRAYGQNFLIDKNIVERGVALGQVAAGDHIVEVGPGLGTLTQAILARLDQAGGGRLTSIEKDARLVPYLTQTFGGNAAWHLIHTDATRVDYTAFAPFKIVANLPYAVASLLLERFLEAGPTRMVLMVQRELAERWLSPHDCKQFSALSIFLQSMYRGRVGHSVPASCFWPPPQVQSVLLVLEKRADAVVFTASQRRLVRTLFLNRRKQLHKAAEAHPASAVWFAQLVATGAIKQTARAEEIPLELWQKLAT